MFKVKNEGWKILFDYSILKSNVGYSNANYEAVKKVFQKYRCSADRAIKNSENYKNDADQNMAMNHDFRVSIAKSECEMICPNEDELCDILCDICYTSEHSKQFAWDVCGETMIRNLMERNDNNIQYPKKVSSGGEFTFSGDEYIMQTVSSKKEDLRGDDVT